MSKQQKKKHSQPTQPTEVTQAQASQEVPLVTEICSMDDIFPGFLQWYKERQARADKHEHAVQVHPLEQGLFEAWKQAVMREKEK